MDQFLSKGFYYTWYKISLTNRCSAGYYNEIGIHVAYNTFSDKLSVFRDNVTVPCFSTPLFNVHPYHCTIDIKCLSWCRQIIVTKGNEVISCGYDGNYWF